MKDVISVDRILYKLAGAERTFRVSETKTALHALLISKLPEKAEGYRNDNSSTDIVEKMRGNYDYEDGFNSAIDDVKAVLDELFGVGDE